MDNEPAHAKNFAASPSTSLAYDMSTVKLEDSIAKKKPMLPTTPTKKKSSTSEDLETSSVRRSGRARNSVYETFDYSGARPQPRKSPQKDMAYAAVPQTERQHIREQIAITTKPKRDAFILAHKHLFLPLLEHSRYLTRLEEAQTASAKPNNHEKAALHGENTMSDAPPIQQVGQISQPVGIKAVMKSYQLEGLVFLVKMYLNGMPAILGDEMGLGKTLQTLALFQWLIENHPVTGEVRPFLVICPLSVLSSWENEVKKWLPSMSVVRFHGSKDKRQELKQVVARYQLCITTYEVFTAEQSWLQRAFVWRYVVVDEGHRIKNHNAQASHALQGLNAEYRLLLTGTPLQNDLKEMWALLHWLLPEVFVEGTDSLFGKAFDLRLGTASATFMDDARRLLELLMLRRMKSSAGVNIDLPPKEVISLAVPLTAEQRQVYMSLITAMDLSTFEEVFKQAVKKETVVETIENSQEHSTPITRKTEHNRWKLLKHLISQLRKVCTHPYLLEDIDVDVSPSNICKISGKFIILDKMIQEVVVQRKKKLIIFSGFTSTLDLVEDLLCHRGANQEAYKRSLRYVRLDGNTPPAIRNLSMRLFNDIDSGFDIILISTRAGGLGITLVAASDVVFLDEDWNPQVTLQAEARAHRIGQTQKVTIYKLYAQGTVEQQMLSRIHKKLYLSTKITESMRNIHTPGASSKRRLEDTKVEDDDGPQLGVSQLMTLLRRGSGTLVSRNVDAAQMIDWDWSTVLERFKDKLDEGDAAPIDESEWLSQVERVETTVFEGRKHVRSPEKQVKVEELNRADRRIGKNVTVMVDGYAVSKDSLSCGSWEAVAPMSGKDMRLAEPPKRKKPAIKHQTHCQCCLEEGALMDCAFCPRAYHPECVEDLKFTGFGKSFYCSQHRCNECKRSATDAGGLLYRCRWCEKSYCEDCIDWATTKLIDNTLPELDVLEYQATSAWYVECSECVSQWKTDRQYELTCEKKKQAFERQHADYMMRGSPLDVTLEFRE